MNNNGNSNNFSQYDNDGGTRRVLNEATKDAKSKLARHKASMRSGYISYDDVDYDKKTMARVQDNMRRNMDLQKNSTTQEWANTNSDYQQTKKVSDPVFTITVNKVDESAFKLLSIKNMADKISKELTLMNYIANQKYNENINHYFNLSEKNFIAMYKIMNDKVLANKAREFEHPIKVFRKNYNNLKETFQNKRMGLVSAATEQTEKTVDSIAKNYINEDNKKEFKLSSKTEQITKIVEKVVRSGITSGKIGYDDLLEKAKGVIEKYEKTGQLPQKIGLTKTLMDITMREAKQIATTLKLPVLNLPTSKHYEALLYQRHR
ncbi:MAG: hypothetical protein LBU68_01550, partial [Rickettsiales bacterium]|nr:hypothetical protein [Rickettsiales bacterium]